jgi:hypothetical protein
VKEPIEVIRRYSGKWLKAAENSVADEMVLADPFFTPDAYLNPKSYPTNSGEKLSLGEYFNSF